ncbi:hypothetical protein J6590_029049 [Homalodisca vitripennis]|nr:hypothetical protein J6590_029049 [Homalodisca vitripennis]
MVNFGNRTIFFQTGIICSLSVATAAIVVGSPHGEQSLKKNYDKVLSPYPTDSVPDTLDDKITVNRSRDHSQQGVLKGLNLINHLPL